MPWFKDVVSPGYGLLLYTPSIVYSMCIFSLRRKSWQQNNDHVVMNVQWTQYPHISIFHDSWINNRYKSKTFIGINVKILLNLHTNKININWELPLDFSQGFVNSPQNVNNAPRHHSTTIYTRWPIFPLPFYSFPLFSSFCIVYSVFLTSIENHCTFTITE